MPQLGRVNRDWLAKTVLLPKEERAKLDDDIRIFGCGWICITEGDIAQRVTPARIKIEPESK